MFLLHRFLLLSIITGALITSSWASAKSIVYNGTECTFTSNNNGYNNVWAPSTPGLYGFNPTSSVVCPVLQQSSEGYTYSDLSYVALYGINLKSAKLCKRNSSGSVACGSSYDLGSSWILYKPSGGGQYDDSFVVIQGASGISLIKDYAVVWTN